MNWDEMEGLFCQQLTQGSPKFDTPESRRSRRDEVTIINAIFIKLFFTYIFHIKKKNLDNTFGW